MQVRETHTHRRRNKNRHLHSGVVLDTHTGKCILKCVMTPLNLLKAHMVDMPRQSAVVVLWPVNVSWSYLKKKKQKKPKTKQEKCHTNPPLTRMPYIITMWPCDLLWCFQRMWNSDLKGKLHRCSLYVIFSIKTAHSQSCLRCGQKKTAVNQV